MLQFEDHFCRVKAVHDMCRNKNMFWKVSRLLFFSPLSESSSCSWGKCCVSINTFLKCHDWLFKGLFWSFWNILSYNVIPSLEMLKWWQFKCVQTSDTVPVIPAILIFLQYMSHQIKCKLAYLCVSSRRRRQWSWTCKATRLQKPNATVWDCVSSVFCT